MSFQGLFFRPVTILLFLAFSPLCKASRPDTSKVEVSAIRTDLPMKLSGRMDDPSWLKAVPVSLTYEISPGENIPAREKTNVYVLYDDEYIYIGFRCFDSNPGLIRANLSDRDKIFNDDFVLVSIDTYNNYQRGFEFAVNPFGIQGDLLMMGVESEDESYDMVWHSAASMDSTGWIAEMAIPFRSLSFSGEPEQEWTISFLRNMPRDNRYKFTWTPYDRNNPSFIAQGGMLSGLTGMKSRRSIEFLPYIMLQKSGSRSEPSDPSSPMNNEPVGARIGGGVQFSPGPAMTVNAVVNPDFSQIESDADQLSVNTTFALFYPEKRPFFMTGMDLVQTPMYYSRTINNPLFASKINGKAGKLSYLALAAYDRASGITVPGEEESNTIETGKESFASVGRLRYDLGNENFIGVLWLSRNFTAAHNYVNGLDWNFKFWKNWYFQGELFLSATREMNDTILFMSERQFGSTGHDAAFNGENYLGTGTHLSLLRQGRNYSFSLTQNNFSPTYQTYNGMFPEIGKKSTYMTHRYTVYPNGKILKSASLYNSMYFVNNYSGVMKEFVIQPGVRIQLVGQTQINANYLAVNRERFRDVFFHGIGRAIVSIETKPLKGLTISVEGQAGRFIYRSFNPEMGKGYDLTSMVEAEPFPRLKTGFSWTTAELHDAGEGNSFYNGHIIRNLTTFQFSKQIFLRNILQYNTFSETFSIYPLITYKFNAFTMFCAGMTRDMQNYEPEYSLRSTGYQYFMKLQYLFGN